MKIFLKIPLKVFTNTGIEYDLLYIRGSFRTVSNSKQTYYFTESEFLNSSTLRNILTL